MLLVPFLLLPMPTEPLCPSGALHGWLAAGEEPVEGAEWSERLDCETEVECRALLSALADPRPAVVAARTLDPEGPVGLDAPVRVAVELECADTGAVTTWSCDGACLLQVGAPAFPVPAQARR